MKQKQLVLYRYLLLTSAVLIDFTRTIQTDIKKRIVSNSFSWLLFVLYINHFTLA